MEDTHLYDEFQELLRQWQAVGQRSLQKILRFQDALQASVRGRDKARWAEWLRMRKN